MSTGNGLVSFVHVYDETGQPHAFGPEDTLPDWAAEQMGPHCFEGGVKPAKTTRKTNAKEASDG